MMLNAKFTIEMFNNFSYNDARTPTLGIIMNYLITAESRSYLKNK